MKRVQGVTDPLGCETTSIPRYGIADHFVSIRGDEKYKKHTNFLPHPTHLDPCLDPSDLPCCRPHVAL